ncbi:hypothetical protein AWB67_04758 [Caballeronia terrestris]|uniref:Lipoprotein n=1 Tax=Caballeronia terrestris TaxID=1226301 RepID=A0A158K381_9BURK|nr:hypothetical protein [Caballeronia terrestris]SAL75425.1 hypothetical protein AWB67_04758 [Caballeronia terrestris]
MKILAFLPLLLSLPMVALARKGWRLFAVLVLAALITGCTSASNKFDKSPCACEFELLNTGTDGGKDDA